MKERGESLPSRRVIQWWGLFNGTERGGFRWDFLLGLGERETAKGKGRGQFWKIMVLKCAFLV